MRAIFDLVNKNLRKLDDGGYKVKVKGKIQRFEKSDVKIKYTFVDRNDGNKTKRFVPHELLSHVYTFQEAVERMPGRSEFFSRNPCYARHDVHVRMLALFRDPTKGPDPIGDGGSEVFSYFAFLLFLQCTIG